MDKTQAYCDLLKLFGKMLDPQQQTKINKSSQDRKKLGQEMGMVGMNIALLGSDNVVTALINWRVAALTRDTEQTLKKFSVLLHAMRSDLKETKITDYGTLLDCFITMGD